MKRRFAGLKARDYEFRYPDGTIDRHVIALYMGDRKVGFMEYDNARQFVDVIHDLCDANDRNLKIEASNEPPC